MRKAGMHTKTNTHLFGQRFNKNGSLHPSADVNLGTVKSKDRLKGIHKYIYIKSGYFLRGMKGYDPRLRITRKKINQTTKEQTNEPNSLLYGYKKVPLSVFNWFSPAFVKYSCFFEGRCQQSDFLWFSYNQECPTFPQKTQYPENQSHGRNKMQPHNFGDTYLKDALDGNYFLRHKFKALYWPNLDSPS